MKTESSHVMPGAGWNGPFWFAVLSPVFGIPAGFLAFSSSAADRITKPFRGR